MNKIKDRVREKDTARSHKRKGKIIEESQMVKKKYWLKKTKRLPNKVKTSNSKC